MNGLQIPLPGHASRNQTQRQHEDDFRDAARVDRIGTVPDLDFRAAGGPAAGGVGFGRMGGFYFLEIGVGNIAPEISWPRTK
jgi:hypothetical protein